MIVLPNMGLVKWDSINDFFSHEQLAANFQALDEHNHIAGKGVPIPYGGLAEQSVGKENLREGAFDASMIANESIEASKIKNKTITEGKLADGVIGSTKFKPTNGFVTASSKIDPVEISFQDVPGTSTVITPTIESYLFIWARFIGYNKEASTGLFSGSISVDGSGVSTNIEGTTPPTIEAKTCISGMARVTLTVAAHTVKLQVKGSSGNMVLQKAGTEFFYMLVTK